MANCKICDGAATKMFDAEMMGRHATSLDRCTVCGFIQASDPYWLAEAYEKPINDVDIGMIERSIATARMTESVILSFFDPAERFVDFGAGYGVFVRRMRDMGYDFRWSDSYCQNIFARHFEHREGDRYRLVTAFEVFEHLADPVAETANMLALGDNILLSTVLVPEGVREEKDWWYFGTDHGQHIAFYTRDALRRLADRFGLHLASNGTEMHLLSQDRVSEARFRSVIQESLASKVRRRLYRRRAGVGTLLMTDFADVSQR